MQLRSSSNKVETLTVGTSLSCQQITKTPLTMKGRTYSNYTSKQNQLFLKLTTELFNNMNVAVKIADCIPEHRQDLKDYYHL
jgi:hypothetical protein